MNTHLHVRPNSFVKPSAHEWLPLKAEDLTSVQTPVVIYESIVTGAIPLKNDSARPMVPFSPAASKETEGPKFLSFFSQAFEALGSLVGAIEKGVTEILVNIARGLRGFFEYLDNMRVRVQDKVVGAFADAEAEAVTLPNRAEPGFQTGPSRRH